MKMTSNFSKFAPRSFQRKWFVSLKGKPVLAREKGGGFVVIEGLDGSGQSTQAALLRDFFSEKGLQVVLTKEPTIRSRAGKKIRQILDKKIKTTPKKLQELFIQDRKEHLENIIIPALEKGKMVISDRYFFSTFAYGAADGLSLEQLIKMNSNFLLPDLTFFLKVSPEVCLKRIQKRGEPNTLFEKREKLARVWKVYKILPRKIKNVRLIEGERPIEEVFSQIKKIVLSQFPNLKQGGRYDRIKS